MNEELHSYVDVRADFPRPESIDVPTGSELATILADELPKHGVQATKSKDVDFAHYVECSMRASTIELMVGAEYLDEADNRWYVQVCPKRTFFGRQAVTYSDYRELLLAVDAVLRECDRVSEIRWFPNFEVPEYLALMPRADGPIRAPDYIQQLHPLIWFDWQLDRISNQIVSPLGILSFFILACVLAFACPGIGPAVVFFLFCFALVLMTVVPGVLWTLIAREANRRKRHSD